MDPALPDGILVIDKPVGPTSHDIVARARRALGTSRVGHTGTLDPAASGVLALVVGRATRLARFLSATTKDYEAHVAFGRATDSYDAAGTVTVETGRHPTREAIEAALDGFRGTFLQTPPSYSAKKVGGERAYRLARRATPVVPAAVPVTVEELRFLEWAPGRARLFVRASAGFYVRALAHDLGVRLGCGAHLAGLRRLRAGAFGLAEAVAAERLEPAHREHLRDRLVPLDDLLPELAAVRLTAHGLTRVRHGQDVGPADLESGCPPPDGPVRLLDEQGRLVGIADRVSGEGVLHPSVVLG